MPRIGRRHLAGVEQLAKKLSAELKPLRRFILPGGSQTAAMLHLARTTCRRAERYCVHLSREAEINPDAVPYLNRLGDVLFLLARWANQQRGVPETCWEQ